VFRLPLKSGGEETKRVLVEQEIWPARENSIGVRKPGTGGEHVVAEPVFDAAPVPAICNAGMTLLGQPA
jgi:hypothetical protein